MRGLLLCCSIVPSVAGAGPTTSVLMVALVLLDKAQGQTTGANVFADRAALLAARDAWCADPTAAAVTYGPINSWDVSAVRDLSFLFCVHMYSSSSSYYADCNPACSTFNDYIGDWNTSSATNMQVSTRCSLPSSAHTPSLSLPAPLP